MTEGLAIIGASYAGVHMAASARENGYDGPITILGDEADAPYQRPPLSKGYLTGKVTEASLPLRGATFFAENRITLRLGVPATAIDRRGRAVVLADNTRQGFTAVAIATGSRARSLPIPGTDLAGVHTLRSLADARRLAADMPAAQKAVIIGGGFIGLEVAASLALGGCSVTVLEASDRLLSRAATCELAAFVAAVHRRHGVTILTGVQATAIRGLGGRVTAVDCTDGVLHPADLVVLGVGAVPNGDLAVAAGVVCDQAAVIVDRAGRTNEPEVFAAGDCACLRHGNGLLRLESIQNATEGGRAAGAALAGKSLDAAAVPWFWSDQYDLKIQMAGLSAGYDRVVVRGRIDDGKFGLYYFRSGRLVSVDTVNRPAEHLLARKLLLSVERLTPETARDESIDLRSL